MKQFSLTFIMLPAPPIKRRDKVRSKSVVQLNNFNKGKANKVLFNVIYIDDILFAKKKKKNPHNTA